MTTEIIRHSLNSAANQMKSALVRTAFSQVIYEVLDFAVALYDREIRMLAQAPSLPAFMGTLSFCVEGAIEGVGGEDKLEPGDIVLYNVPYGAGSHAQDAALVMPVFLHSGELVGYSVIKAHWLDIGGKEPYSTDTVDVFQEGTMYPGIKLYRRGERVEDIFRMVLANSRVPKAVSGDIRAQVTGVRIGAEGLVRIVERYGTGRFRAAVERMYDHGEAVVRNYLSKIPDGRYVGSGMLDNDGINDDPIPFEVAVEIDGATARVDFSNAPDAVEGPMNSPLPRTVSAARIALSMLAGGHEAPTEGHFRPIEVVTRPGSIFHALPPSPIFLCGRIAMQAIEVIYEAIAKVVPELVPAWSGSDLAHSSGGESAKRPASPGRTAPRTPWAPADMSVVMARRSCILASPRPVYRRPRSGKRRTPGCSKKLNSRKIPAAPGVTAAAWASICATTCWRTSGSPRRSSAPRPRPGASREARRGGPTASSFTPRTDAPSASARSPGSSSPRGLPWN